MSLDSTSSRTHSAELSRIIQQCRRRLRLLAFCKTLTWILLAALLILGLALWAMDWTRYDPAWVEIIRWSCYSLLTVLLLTLLLLPWLGKLPARRLALYLEEHSPELRQVLLSAVEWLPAKQTDSLSEPRGLPAALIQQAVRLSESLDLGKSQERKRIARAAVGSVAVLAMAGVLYYWQPPLLQNGLPYLLPWRQAEAHNPYTLAVQPGDQRLLQGDDQLIAAQALGFAPPAAELWTRRLDNAPWQNQAMVTAASGLGYELFLFDVQHSLEYFVEADGVRSDVYRLDVIEPPSVEQLELTYHYPQRTGLTPKTVTGEGDINALPGTRIELRVQTNKSTPERGELVFNGSQRLALHAEQDGWLSAEFTIDAPGVYRIDLPAQDDPDPAQYLPATPDYRITVREDRPPALRFTTPGRDIQVTNIEEPVLALSANDDLALRTLELKLMINGGAEQSLALYDQAGEHNEFSAEHVVYLEELNLQPGDLIAYYGRAVDQGLYGDGQETATDMYFLQIRPFEREYRAADQQGGGGGGGQDEGALSAQQRQFVVAIFKLQRDRLSLPEATFGERRDTLTEVQARIRDRVEAIVRRLAERGAVQQHEGYRQMLEELPKAVTEMQAAETALSGEGPEQALAPAQKALQHLQRAEAAFRETQIAQGGQGGGGDSQAEDLAELFQLELDKLRNQYEQVQRGQAQEQQELDELLRKLRELARRQQQELERQQRRLAQSSQNSAANSSSSSAASSSNSGSSGQQALAEAAEELARQLERLSRKRNDPSSLDASQQNKNSQNQTQQASNTSQNRRSSTTALNNAQQRLQQAIRQMQEAAGQSGQQGVEARQAALQALQQALRDLSEPNHVPASRLAQDLDNAQRRAERLAAWQKQGLDTLSEWRQQQTERAAQNQSQKAPQGGAESASHGQSNRNTQSDTEAERPDTSALRQRKQQMALESEALEQELRRMIRPSEEEYPELSRQLRGIVSDLDQHRLTERLQQMDRLLQWQDLDSAVNLESYIDQVLEQLNADLQQAQTALREGSGQDLEQALAQVQDLMRDVASGQTSEQSSNQAASGENASGEQNQAASDSQTQQNNQQQAQNQQGSQSGQQPGQQQASNQQGSQQPGGQPSSGQSGNQQSGAPQSGAQQSGAPQSGAQQSGAQQSGAQQSGAQQSGAQQSGAPQSGEQIAGGQQGSSPNWQGASQGNGVIDSDSRGTPPGGRFGPPGPRQAESWGETAVQLAENLRARGIEMDRINAVLSGVRQFEQNSAQAGTQDLAQYQAALLDNLQQLEYALRKQLEPDRPEARLPLAPAPVAPEHRAEVERYFKDLARQRIAPPVQ